MKLFRDLEDMHHKLNTFVSVYAPEQHEALKNLSKLAGEEYPFFKILQHADPSYIEGKAIMFNRRTPAHKDKLDPESAWALLICLGDFTEGGELEVQELKLVMRFLPGDVIML
jgi:hypothetical protein